MENDQAFAGALVAGAAIVAALSCMGYLAVTGFVCWLLSGWLKRIPEAHRKQTPGMVWLLMIPLFSLFWNFMVFPKISESYDSYFKAKGETAESTAKLAQLFCIACPAVFVLSMVLNFIPILSMLSSLAGLAVLVILIILLVKYNELKNRIPLQTA